MKGTTEIRKVRCSFGHYYDGARFTECPHCRSMLYTPVITDEEKREIARLASVYVHGKEEKKTERPAGSRSISQRRKDNYFVTGWLVCIEGPDFGRCFPLYHGENALGRDANNAVCLERDEAVKMAVHCVIQYAYETASFYLIPEKDLPVFVNEVRLEAPVSIRTGDLIRVGSSLMEFVAFCVGDHKWNRQGERAEVHK